MADEEIHYAESVGPDEDDEYEHDEYADDEDFEEFSPLNFVKRNNTLMSIGPVRKFVEWMDDEKTEPDAYLTMLLSCVFIVAVLIGIISMFVDF